SYSYITNDYNYLNGTLYRDEVAEDITYYRPFLVRGYAGYFFSAGEYAKDESSQGVYMATYTKDGQLIKSALFNDNSYKEYVKKVLFTYKSLYIVCNAVDVSSGDSALLVLRYDMDLVFKAKYIFKPEKYFSPADAVAAVGGVLSKIDEIYIACSKKDNQKSALAAIHLDSNLNILHSFKYNYTGATDNNIEQPADIDILYDTITHNTTIYVAGNITGIGGSTLTNNLLIKLNGSLKSAWVKANTSANGLYTSVKQFGAPDYTVYAAGNQLVNTKTKWSIDKINPSAGQTLVHKVYAVKSYQTNVLKITRAANNIVTVAGYRQSESLNKYDIVVGVYDEDLVNTTNYIIEHLTYGSSVNDAVQDNDATWITGKKKNGSNEYIFVYKIDPYSGNSYKDSVVNTKSAGNCITVLPRVVSYPDSSRIAMCGFKNNSNTLIQPLDLKYTTRFYIPYLNTIVDKKNEMPAAAQLINNSPNPFTNSTIINYTLPLQYSSARIIITDKNGKLINESNVSGNGKGSLNFNASLLSNGTYYYTLYVNEKIVATKQMTLIK
ncbi:MAG: hypothetical protein ABI405_08620, partial [Parafilimonas sp.]